MMLNSRGYEVYGYSLDPLEGGIFQAANLHEDVARDTRGDIRDVQLLEQALISANPDLVIHMAAQPLVRASYRNPRETFEVNVTGTLNVLEASKKVANVQGIAVVTTDKVYRNLEERKPFVETDPLGARDPYSTSKAMADLLAQTWARNEADIPIAIFRAGNVIGGGDVSDNRLIPDVVRAQRSKTAPILRNPNSVRPWQHVLDCLEGYQLALDFMLKHGESIIFNFGPLQNGYITVGEVATNFIDIGKTIQWKQDNSNTLHEADFLALNSNKAREVLGWKERLSWKQTLEATHLWYEAQAGNYDMNIFTKEQIKNHEKTQRLP
jgi:CDP-glucose 4,6-dehydratase